MSVIEISKIKTRQVTGPIVRPVNEDEFFEKKAAQARAFLEKHPVPDHLFQKKS